MKKLLLVLFLLCLSGCIGKTKISTDRKDLTLIHGCFGLCLLYLDQDDAKANVDTHVDIDAEAAKAIMEKMPSMPGIK